MSKKSWELSWGKIIPLIQTKIENKNQNKVLDQKIAHAISQILESGADINAISPNIQCTILHLCVGKGLVKSAQLLIKKGADTKKTNLFHETPDKYIQFAPFNKERLEKLFSPPIVLTNKKSR